MSSMDLVIEAYKKDVDVTLLDENLKRTAEERVLALQKFEEFREELRKSALKTRDQLR
ncbi:MAG: hypothetical protein SFV54_16410 [Bryobacteraceae bacterium]|nr:hypothetical protein [Bryobacteraceae bacterium]